MPLALMCKGFFNFDPRVEITPVLGDQNYDAIVTDRRPNPVTFGRIEVTQAHEGEDEYLRMLDLERKGHTSLLGSVRKSGIKSSGITVSIESTAMSHADILDRQIRLVQDAIERKLAKQYPPDTALLVVFEDNIAIQDEEDCLVFTSLLEQNRERLRTSFNWAGVAGWNQKCFRFLE